MNWEGALPIRRSAATAWQPLDDIGSSRERDPCDEVVEHQRPHAADDLRLLGLRVLPAQHVRVELALADERAERLLRRARRRRVAGRERELLGEAEQIGR